MIWQLFEKRWMLKSGGTYKTNKRDLRGDREGMKSDLENKSLKNVYILWVRIRTGYNEGYWESYNGSHRGKVRKLWCYHRWTWESFRKQVRDTDANQKNSVNSYLWQPLGDYWKPVCSNRWIKISCAWWFQDSWKHM